MFRPEMLEPMGLDPRINVIAWGLSVERYSATGLVVAHSTQCRPTMIKYGYKDIRDLFGHTVSYLTSFRALTHLQVNLTMARDAEMCRL